MKRPIRVLYTLPNLITAGGGQVLADLFAQLDRTLVTPIVCVNQSGGALQDRMAELDVEVVEAPFTVDPRPLSTMLPRCWTVACGLRGVHADIWHSWHYIDDYTEPIIARMAGTRRWVYTKKSMAWRDRGWRVRTALASGILATNTDMAKDYFGTPRLRRHTEVVLLGLDPARFEAAVPLDLTALAGVPADALVVTSVARIHRGKSIEVAIEAMVEAPGAHLLVAGRVDNDEYERELEELIARLGLSARVHLLGGVSDVPGLLAASDLFVLPSGESGEGCPIALLEAMASGLACVAADTAGSREVVADRRSGRIVPIDDAPAMGRAFAELLDDPELRLEYGRVGRARVARDFTVERSARAHERFYVHLMG